MYSPNYIRVMEEDADEVVSSFEEESPEIRPIKEVEREMIRKALETTGGNRKQAARMLGIPERTFYRKLKLHGLGSSQ